MMDLLALIGAAFLLKGTLFVFGRTIPKGVRAKLGEERQIRRWGRNMGIMQLLWGCCCLLLWAAARWTAAVYLMPLFWAFLIAGVIFSIRLLRQYQPN